VNTPVFVAMMLGTIPALILRFYMLRAFEGMFEDQPVLFAFVIGMVAGVIVGVFHVWVDGALFGSVLSALLFFVVGFAFVDQFLKVVIFNSPRFSGKAETTFYATAFGLGYGAMLTGLWFYRSFVMLDAGSNGWIILSYVCAAFAFAVVHGTTGMLVGFGATEGIVWRYGLLSVVLQAPLNIMWWLAMGSSLYATDPIWELGAITMFLAAGYGLFLLRWTMAKIVPDLLPRQEMRKRRRLMRRQRRAGEGKDEGLATRGPRIVLRRSLGGGPAKGTDRDDGGAEGVVEAEAGGEAMDEAKGENEAGGDDASPRG
jgi:uncharacterized membrane protein YuzA (DUF378 family)